MTSDDKHPTDLRQKGIGAVLWGSIGAVARIALQIVSQIILARILGPESFGVFAISLTIVLLASMFADLGLAYGLIQRPSVTDADIRFVFTWQMILAVAMTLALVALAQPIAHLFGDPRLTPVIRWLSLGCILASAGATAGMLMRRNLDFKTLNIAIVLSYAVGFLCVGIPMALLGWGVWSLVTAYLIQIGLASVITYAAARHAIRPLFRHPDSDGILTFGTTVLATNLLNWVMMSLDRLVIGLTMQTSAVGIYSTMSNLMTAPVVTLTSVFQSALYATSARAQDDTDRLRVALISVLGAVALFIAPIFFAIGTVAETLILAAYGEKWAGAGVVLRPLAFGMPAYLLMAMAIPTLWASGRTKWEFKLQLPMAFLWAGILFAAGSTNSLTLLSWSACAWFYIRAIVIVGAARYALGLGLRDATTPLTAGVVATLIVMCAAAATDQLMATAGVHPIAAVVAIVIACAIALVLGLSLASSLIAPDVRRLLDSMASRLPNGIGALMLRRVLGNSA